MSSDLFPDVGICKKTPFFIFYMLNLPLNGYLGIIGFIFKEVNVKYGVKPFCGWRVAFIALFWWGSQERYILEILGLVFLYGKYKYRSCIQIFPEVVWTTFAYGNMSEPVTCKVY